MKANLSRKTVLFFVIPLLLSLVFLPAICRAAPPSGALPEPTDFVTVDPGTRTTSLHSIFQLDSSYSITVYKADGSVRSSSLLETGDLVFILDASGMSSCIQITVNGQPAPSSGVSSDSSGPPVSSSPESNTSSSPASSTSSSPASSTSSSPESNTSSSPESNTSSSPEGGTSSSPASSTPSSVDPKEAVFEEPVDVESTAGLFADCAPRVTVFAPNGSERKSGPVCTDDRIVLQDKSGTVLRILPVTILGDLTRCGKPTESGCSLLYEYLTGNASLSDDLSAAADMNRDGRIDTADLLKMKFSVSGNPPSSGG